MRMAQVAWKSRHSCYIHAPLCRAPSRAMARVLAVMLMALAFVQAGALDSDEDRPKRARGAGRGGRRQDRLRPAWWRQVVLGCARRAVPGEAGPLLDHLPMKTKSGSTVEKRGVVRGPKVLMEPPFPEGTALGAWVKFENGAHWERKW